MHLSLCKIVIILLHFLQGMTVFAIMKSHLRILTTELYVTNKSSTACELTRYAVTD